MRPWLAVAACVVGIGLAFGTDRLAHELGGAEFGGVRGCDPHQCSTPILGRAIDDLRNDVLRRPIAREPEFDLTGGEEGYRAEGLVGWHVLATGSIVLAILGTFRLLRLRLRPPGAGLAVAGLAFAVFVYLCSKGLEGD